MVVKRMLSVIPRTEAIYWLIDSSTGNFGDKLTFKYIFKR